MTPSSKVSGWAQQVAHFRAARVFIDACEAAAIPVLPVKGIVTAYTLYDDPANRPLTDVDLRVVPRDLRRVARLCETRGWSLAQRSRTYANLVARVDGVSVDVEAYVGPPGLCRLAVRTMLERAKRMDIVGVRTLIPDFTDHALLLIVNAFKDKLVGAFRWSIRDLEVLPRHPSFDADAIAARARASGVRTITWVVADWLHRVRGVDPWRAVCDALGPKPPRPRYVAMLTSRFLTRHDGLSARVLGRIGADSVADRAIALSVMLAWGLETSLSQWGETPYRRGRVPPWDPNERDDSS